MRFFSTVLLFFSLFVLSNVFADNNVHVFEVTHVKWKIPRTITVNVLDRDGAPLADAEVQLGTNDNLYRKNMADYPLFVEGKTDHNGRWTITLPDDWFDGTTKIHSVELRVTTAKYPASPTRLKKWFISSSKKNPIVIPKEITVSFEGMMYPIHVVDEKGNPIEGVEITTSSGHASRTDSRGIYEYGPAGTDLTIGANVGPTFIFHHPDYQNVELPGRFAESRKMSIPEIVTLNRGGEIFGKVVDQQGRPVVGAFIYVYGERLFTERETVTDDRGEYHLKGLAVTDQILIVGKSGMRNDVRTVACASLNKRIVITLEPAKTIRIQVVTTDDRPLQGVIVTPACASAFGKFSYEPLQKQIFTDENGFWEWNDAPDGEIQYHIGADLGRVPGVVNQDKTYRTAQDVYSLKPQETPHRIVAEEYDRSPGENPVFGPSREYTSWKASKKLTVRVLDENLKPLAGALVEPYAPPGEYYSDGITVKEPFLTDENGIVIFDFPQADLSDISDFEVRVSAEIYPTAGFFDTYQTMENYHVISRKTLPDTFDAILSPKDMAVGVVRDEEGQPVEGATVLLSRDFYPPQANVLPRPIDGSTSTTTDANGLWKIKMPDFLIRDPACVERLHAIVSKKGYFVNSKPLTPFQRIVTLKKAKRLSIRVTDEEGEPLGEVIVYRDNSPCGKTNANGEWAYDFDVKHKKTSLLLYKPGMSYRTHTIDLNGEIENLHYTLKRGGDIRVRFVLDDQAIIPQMAWVSIQTVPQKGDFFRSRQIHELKDPLPNENGVFILENMPENEAYYRFTFADQQDFRTEESQYLFAPGDDEQVVRLVRARNINKPADIDFSRETPYGLIKYSQAGFNLP